MFLCKHLIAVEFHVFQKHLLALMKGFDEAVKYKKVYKIMEFSENC